MFDFIKKRKEKKAGCCPSCGTSWLYLKDKSKLIYLSNRRFYFGVWLCQDCINNPNKINLSKIREYLDKIGWKKPEIKLTISKIEEIIPIKVIRKEKLKNIKETWKV